uniref:Isopropylmalate dehydrogenase-like domain-containing protein n=1 Tax=Oncorhynchus tshawytscha TaxID=74940 RepID=A0A8C8D6A4_ONCTS
PNFCSLINQLGCLLIRETGVKLAQMDYYSLSLHSYDHLSGCARGADATFTVTVVPGDGVGPELMTAVKEVFKAADLPVEFEEFHLSEVQHMDSNEKLQQLLASMKTNRVAMKGKINTPVEFKGERLHSTVFYRWRLPGYSTRHNNLVIIREQTEGEYSYLDHEIVPGVIECLKIITREFAFDYATKKVHGRFSLLLPFYRNLADGLFLRCCAEVAELYPKIKYNNLIIDSCCMQLVQNPYQFDVLVMPNLYGNIIDNLAAGLVDGPGVVPGESYSVEYAVFETESRNPFAQAVGRNIGNPTAMLLSTANMLHHLNLEYHCNMLSYAVRIVIKQMWTRDLGGYSTTRDSASCCGEPPPPTRVLKRSWSPELNGQPNIIWIY